MKNEPLEGNLHYGIDDREYLDRNPKSRSEIRIEHDAVARLA